MRSCHSLDRIDVVFVDAGHVANAGLLLPAILAEHLGLKGLIERFLDLGRNLSSPVRHPVVEITEAAPPSVWAG